MLVTVEAEISVLWVRGRELTPLILKTNVNISSSPSLFTLTCHFNFFTILNVWIRNKISQLVSIDVHNFCVQNHKFLWWNIPTKSGLTDTRIREFWRSTDMGGVGAGSIMGAVAENRTQWNNKIIRRRFRRNRRLGRSSSSQQIAASNSCSNRWEGL